MLKAAYCTDRTNQIQHKIKNRGQSLVGPLQRREEEETGRFADMQISTSHIKLCLSDLDKNRGNCC